MTFKHDNARTGLDPTETTLTPANVHSRSFGLKHLLQVDGRVDAQPLYLSHLTVAGASHNVVFVATEHDSVYAFDADTGETLWQVSVAPAGESASDAIGCDQIVPEIGVTATPVIDRSAGAHGTLYLVAMTRDAGGAYHHRLHALDVTTGAERLGGPTEISATYPNGSPSRIARFEPIKYAERAALLLSRGVIYTTWTSHCDTNAYSGWVIAYSERTLRRTGVVNVAANNENLGRGPSIWMAGDGPAADAAGNVYFITANGLFDTDLDDRGFPAHGDYGNAFVKLSPRGPIVTDYFAVYNTVALTARDQDLGSGGEMLLPDQTDASGHVRHLLVGAGKDGNIYVLDRDHMGKFNPTANHIAQELHGALKACFGTPAYFNGTVYYPDTDGTLKAYPVIDARLATTPSSHTAITFDYPGAGVAISAHGTANAIVWAFDNRNAGPNGTPPAELHAYDARNLAHELYNSNQAGRRDQFGIGNKFITPVIADGHVFVGTRDAVAIFALRHPPRRVARLQRRAAAAALRATRGRPVG